MFMYSNVYSWPVLQNKILISFPSHPHSHPHSHPPLPSSYTLVPNSLDINQQNCKALRKKKRRRRRPNESIADFTTTYELTKEKLGSGARSTVETCRHRKTGREYAVKVCKYRTVGMPGDLCVLITLIVCTCMYAHMCMYVCMYVSMYV